MIWLCSRSQFVKEEPENADEDLDYRALEDGFVSSPSFVYTPFFNLLSLFADSRVAFWHYRLQLLLCL